MYIAIFYSQSRGDPHGLKSICFAQAFLLSLGTALDIIHLRGPARGPHKALIKNQE
jgi:hypothetical protein